MNGDPPRAAAWRSRSTRIAVAIAVAVVAGVAAVVAAFWQTLGASEISAAGWVAMGFGIIATLALGIGLMTLVFISNRRGYDELDRGDR
jgi:predicted benzoate:H+ symporter BenE